MSFKVITSKFSPFSKMLLSMYREHIWKLLVWNYSQSSIKAIENWFCYFIITLCFFKSKLLLFPKNQVYLDGQRCFNLEIMRKCLWSKLSESNAGKCNSISNGNITNYLFKMITLKGPIFIWLQKFRCVRKQLLTCFSHLWFTTEQNCVPCM